MKRTLGMAALACTMAVGPTYARADDSAAIFTTLAAVLLASQFNVAQPVIISDASRYNTTVYDLEPAYYIQAHTPGVTLAQIMALRASGLAWDMVARRVSMPSMYVYNLAPAGAYYPNTFWSNWAYRQYQIPPTQFLAVRNAGAPWHQAFLAAEIAHRYHTQPIYVWQGYRNTHTWNRIVLPNHRVITYRAPARPLATWRVSNRVWRPKAGMTWRSHNTTTWRPRSTSHPIWPKKQSNRSSAALRVHGWTHTEKKGGKVDVWHHNGPKVDITRRVSHHKGTTVRTTRVNNPAQTITHRTVYRNGKVVRSSTTHQRDKTPGKVTTTQRRRTQWYLNHPKKR